LEKRGREDYGLPESQKLAEMEKRLNRLKEQQPFSL